MIYAQVYNISIVDINPPTGQDQKDYLVNITANITDSGNHSLSHEFFVRYVPRPVTNSSIPSTIPPSTTTTSINLSQALHIRIYETTPPNTPIVRGRLISSSTNTTSNSTCTAVDDKGISYPINISQSSFIIYLPNNYTLNSTIRSNIIVYVECDIGNGINVNQDIVIDVLPAPPTIQMNFNQTQPFYATNNINNQSILGTFFLSESQTNRTYDLSLINNQDIFQLLSNGSLVQIGPYPSNIIESNDPHVNLTIQTIKTTSDEPTRIVQTTFRVPVIVNSSIPLITFSRTSISNNINANTIIGNFSIHNFTRFSRLQLLDTLNNTLELDPLTNNLILKKPLSNNQTQISLKVALIDQSNQTILTTNFPLSITYSITNNTCLNKDCGNGTCIQLNETSSYCLCTSGYTGSDCRLNDPCAYNPCVNNGKCHQLTLKGDFICRCLPNYSGSLCEIPLDLCQLYKSSCLTTEICIPIYNSLTNFTKCISRDELQYLVFDYLNDYKTIDVINDKNLPEKIESFIKKNLLSIENMVLLERQILGPYKYDRAELISIGVIPSNENSSTLNDVFDSFCLNQSLIINSFDRELCAGYYQAKSLEIYFNSTPSFCSNCSFIDAADKYYWFDKTIPFLSLWITLILGSLLMSGIPFIPYNTNKPKKVALPLMKAKMHPEDEQSENEDNPVLIKSVRSTEKIKSSLRERNYSGYESDENIDNYLEQIITNHHQQEYHVYPILHQPRSPIDERRYTTIDNLISTNPLPSRPTYRSASMSTQKPSHRQSSVGHQTLKPIIHRRSSILDSTIGALISLTGTPRLNNEDDTYVSSRFRNENTSKFVIGTLWNTFALVNNLFLQRPRKRRNAISGDSAIQADQLAHLQQLYSLAERDQANEQQSQTTDHLQTIISDMFSTNQFYHCNCYGNHHISSCIYYDHSLPYLTNFNNTSNIEKIFSQIHKSNYHDASTQSYPDKPPRIFTHFKPINNVSTQYSPIRNNYKNIDVSTQTMQNHLNDVSTQYQPEEEVLQSIQYHPNPIQNKKDSVIKELKQVITSSIPPPPKETIKIEEVPEKNLPTSSHTVRSLVSMFETSTIANQSNQLSRRKSSVNNSKVLPPPSEKTLLNICSEETQSPIVNDTIEQYADEIASNIVDNAVLTATTTIVYLNEQQQRRFSFYNNAGGHGKSLLFQSNTFVPSTQYTNQESNEIVRAESQASSTLLNDRLTTVNPVNTENEPQHTLIVGRYIDGEDLNHIKTNKHHNSIFDSDSSSLSDEEPHRNHRQFLSNSQLFSAQELYIRPWLVRRATAPDIHCLDNDISDTQVDTITDSTETFFNIFPNNINLNFYTRYTSLITILIYLDDIHDEYSNQILYDELEQMENDLLNSRKTSPIIQSNVCKTINPDGSKRYRTGFIVDINSSNISKKIHAKDIEWKQVKILVRRFRKKYQHYKQFIKNDTKISHQLNLENYFKYFDSTSKRRMIKYAKHYAEKL